MTDYREKSSDNLNANSPGSQGNNKDSDYGAVRAKLLLGLAMGRRTNLNDEGGLFS